MSKNKHLEQLTKLRAEYAAEIANVDPDLSAEGEAKRVERVQARFQTALARVTSAFEAETQYAKVTAAAKMPKAPADTSAAWQRAQMLLDAGQPLNMVIANADAATLHAITEWGPTWVQARDTKAGVFNSPTPDIASLHNSIRQRWSQVLEGGDGQRIREGFEAEAAEAEFKVSSAHLQQKFEGVNNSSSDLERAFAAHYAGQAASAGLVVDA